MEVEELVGFYPGVDVKQLDLERCMYIEGRKVG